MRFSLERLGRVKAPEAGFHENGIPGRVKNGGWLRKIGFTVFPPGLRRRFNLWLEKYGTSTAPYRLSRADQLSGLAIFLFFFSLYLYTCSHQPNIAGDSAEMIGASYSLGISHPPGYPLYTLIGFLFSRLPFGSVAFRVNFSSVVYHSLTVFLFFVCSLKLTRNRAASAIAAVTVAFAPLFWFYSLVAEVFPLNNLLVLLLFFTAIRTRERWQENNHAGAIRFVVLLAFLCGISLCNHHTVVLAFPMILLFILRPLAEILKRPLYILLCLLAFLAGLLPYIYLPISASRSPFINFGDPSSLRNFLDVITRRHYGTSKLWIGPEATNRLDLVLDFVKTLGNQVHVMGFFLGAIGMIHAARKRLGNFVPLICGLLFLGIVFPYLANVKIGGIFQISTVERFYLLPTIVFAFFIADGVAELLMLSRQALKKAELRKDIKAMLLWLLMLLLALPFLLPAKTTATDVSLKYDTVGQTYVHDLLASIDEGSAVFLQGDIAIQLMQLQRVLGNADKRAVYLVQPFLLTFWYGKTIEKWYPDFQFPRLEDLLAQGYLRYSTLRAGFMDYLFVNNAQVPSFHILHKDEDIATAYDLVPWGITYKIAPKGSENDAAQYLKQQIDIWKNIQYGGLEVGFYPQNRREFYLSLHLASFPLAASNYLEKAGLIEEARSFLLLAYTMAPSIEILPALASLEHKAGNEEGYYLLSREVVDSEESDNRVYARKLLTLEDALEALRNAPQIP